MLKMPATVLVGMQLTQHDDVNAVGDQLTAQGARHALQRVLAGSVGRHEGRLPLAGHRAHVDDLAGRALKAAVPSQERQECLDTARNIKNQIYKWKNPENTIKRY